MMIEGLIVYIQTIRLHLYEWFPKWYVGDGQDFKKIIPKMLYTNLIWNNKIVSKPSPSNKKYEDLKQVAR
jgi:V/A-type H+-transporting ATPase subunit I